MRRTQRFPARDPVAGRSASQTVAMTDMSPGVAPRPGRRRPAAVVGRRSLDRRHPAGAGGSAVAGAPHRHGNRRERRARAGRDDGPQFPELPTNKAPRRILWGVIAIGVLMLALAGAVTYISSSSGSKSASTSTDDESADDTTDETKAEPDAEVDRPPSRRRRRRRAAARSTRSRTGSTRSPRTRLGAGLRQPERHAALDDAAPRPRPTPPS